MTRRKTRSATGNGQKELSEETDKTESHVTVNTANGAQAAPLVSPSENIPSSQRDQSNATRAAEHESIGPVDITGISGSLAATSAETASVAVGDAAQPSPQEPKSSAEAVLRSAAVAYPAQTAHAGQDGASQTVAQQPQASSTGTSDSPVGQISLASGPKKNKAASARQRGSRKRRKTSSYVSFATMNERDAIVHLTNMGLTRRSAAGESTTYWCCRHSKRYPSCTIRVKMEPELASEEDVSTTQASNGAADATIQTRMFRLSAVDGVTTHTHTCDRSTRGLPEPVRQFIMQRLREEPNAPLGPQALVKEIMAHFGPKPSQAAESTADGPSASGGQATSQTGDTNQPPSAEEQVDLSRVTVARVTAFKKYWSSSLAHNDEDIVQQFVDEQSKASGSHDVIAHRIEVQGGKRAITVSLFSTPHLLDVLASASVWGFSTRMKVVPSDWQLVAVGTYDAQYRYKTCGLAVCTRDSSKNLDAICNGIRLLMAAAGVAMQGQLKSVLHGRFDTISRQVVQKLGKNVTTCVAWPFLLAELKSGVFGFSPASMPVDSQDAASSSREKSSSPSDTINWKQFLSDVAVLRAQRRKAGADTALQLFIRHYQDRGEPWKTVADAFKEHFTSSSTRAWQQAYAGNTPTFGQLGVGERTVDPSLEALVDGSITDSAQKLVDSIRVYLSEHSSSFDARAPSDALDTGAAGVPAEHKLLLKTVLEQATKLASNRQTTPAFIVEGDKASRVELTPQVAATSRDLLIPTQPVLAAGLGHDELARLAQQWVSVERSSSSETSQSATTAAQAWKSFVEAKARFVHVCRDNGHFQNRTSTHPTFCNYYICEHVVALAMLSGTLSATPNSSSA